MKALHALVLAAIQGVTQFLPVSSSGHMVLIPFILGWAHPSVAFGLAVHAGALGALCYRMRDDIARLARGSRAAPGDPDREMLGVLVAASAPAVVAGVVIAATGLDVGHPVLASVLLGVLGYFLLTTESQRREREVDPVAGQTALRTETQLSTAEALRIGVAQATAVVPGISRTGVTIGESMRAGVTREGAVRFSLLLAIPVLAGAALWQIPGAARSFDAASFAIALIVSAVSAFFAIRWLNVLVTRRGLRAFGAYCFAAMIAGIIASLARG
jgi:undecaprenyl-diphosphatase